MLINKQKTEGKVLDLLKLGATFPKELLRQIQEERNKSISKQGFYKVLRKLKEEDIIIEHNKKISLSPVWVDKFLDFSSSLIRNYKSETNTFEFTNLNEKESLRYKFNSIQNLDNFWGQAQNILMHKTNSFEAIYSYDPHYWFYLARNEVEKTLLKEIVRSQRKFLMTVGGKKSLDKLIKKDFNNKFLQYNIKDIIKENNKYVTVIGDFVIEVGIDKNLADLIDDLYTRYSELTQDLTKELNIILNTKSKNILKISRSKNKSTFYKNKLKKDFY